MNKVEDLRLTGMRMIAMASWANVITLVLLSMTANRLALVAAGISLLVSLVPTFCALKHRSDATARFAMGAVVAIQPALLLYAMQDSIWQTDMHLWFLVWLSVLVPLCDVRPIIAACAIEAIHHGSMALFVPHWAFFDGHNEMVLVSHYTASFSIAGAVLTWISSTLRGTLRRVHEVENRNEHQKQEMKEGLQSLRAAQAELRSERENSARARTDIIAARKAAYENIAAQFEQSVIAVTTSVANTADLLQRSARDLKLLADKAGEEASDVAGGAESASRAANTVAAGVAELSLSIAEVAVHAGQQSELTSLATERSGGGGQAIGSLAQHSLTIGQATRAIARIAERTNLLSLNATIEAASAGEAGRGFSTVAYEVKVLADQAAQAAKEIDSFLNGVQTGTLEAERSFKAIDSAIGELGQAANTIRIDVENQRQSADTIQTFARSAAGEADTMAQQTQALADRVKGASELSTELDHAAIALAENVRNLEASTRSFTANLKAA